MPTIWWTLEGMRVLGGFTCQTLHSLFCRKRILPIPSFCSWTWAVNQWFHCNTFQHLHRGMLSAARKMKDSVPSHICHVLCRRTITWWLPVLASSRGQASSKSYLSGSPDASGQSSGPQTRPIIEVYLLELFGQRPLLAPVSQCQSKDFHLWLLLL